MTVQELLKNHVNCNMCVVILGDDGDAYYSGYVAEIKDDEEMWNKDEILKWKIRQDVCERDGETYFIYANAVITKLPDIHPT
jgi:hypothetical protein